MARKLLTTVITVSFFLGGPGALANLGDTDDPATDDPAFEQAQAAIDTQDWAQAIELLTRTVEAYPESAD
ncbi:MAG: hypothetical protein GTO41_24845, partial [Burkholderiales bacterium]|nr:hypothetical protein [Burkholderiales bacterium]